MAFAAKGVFHMEDANPTLLNQATSRPHTVPWPVGNRILTLEFQILPKSINGGLAAQERIRKLQGQLSRDDFLGFLKGQQIKSQQQSIVSSLRHLCLKEDRSRTLQHGDALFVHQSLPIVSQAGITSAQPHTTP